MDRDHWRMHREAGELFDGFPERKNYIGLDSLPSLAQLPQKQEWRFSQRLKPT